MPPGESDELEGVAHGAQLLLEHGDLGVVQMRPPVERGRAVVGQHLVRVHRVDGLGELTGLVEVGRGGLAPEQVAVGRVGEAALDRRLQSRRRHEEPLRGPLAGQAGPVPDVDVAGDQARAQRVGAGHQDGLDAHDVGGQPGRPQCGEMLRCGHQHLPAHVTALLGRAELILEVDPGRAGLDHRLHQLEGIERAAEARLGVGHDRQHVVAARAALGLAPLDLVGPPERVVEASDQRRHRVRRVEGLVGIHLPGEIGVAGHLPARQVQGGQPRLGELDRLPAGHGPQGVHVVHVVEALPELGRAGAGHGALGRHRAAQPYHLRRGVVAACAVPTGVVLPVGP